MVISENSTLEVGYVSTKDGDDMVKAIVGIYIDVEDQEIMLQSGNLCIRIPYERVVRILQAVKP